MLSWRWRSEGKGTSRRFPPDTPKTCFADRLPMRRHLRFWWSLQKGDVGNRRLPRRLSRRHGGSSRTLWFSTEQFHRLTARACGWWRGWPGPEEGGEPRIIPACNASWRQGSIAGHAYDDRDGPQAPPPPRKVRFARARAGGVPRNHAQIFRRPAAPWATRRLRLGLLLDSGPRLQPEMPATLGEVAYQSAGWSGFRTVPTAIPPDGKLRPGCDGPGFNAMRPRFVSGPFAATGSAGRGDVFDFQRAASSKRFERRRGGARRIGHILVGLKLIARGRVG